MGNNVLYFPNIIVPGSARFTRMLLYWDTVGTIIPAEFMQRSEELGEHTRSLLEAQLLTAVIPGMHLYKVRSSRRADVSICSLSSGPAMIPACSVCSEFFGRTRTDVVRRASGVRCTPFEPHMDY